MVAPIRLAATGSPMQEIAGDLSEQVKALIYRVAAEKRLPLAVVVGVLDIVKLEIIEDQKNGA